MLQVGPLISFWSMRWESKHKPSKQGAHIVSARVNLPLTLAIRHQMQECYRFFSAKPFVSAPVCGPCTYNCELRSLEHYSKFCKILPMVLLKKKSAISVKWASLKGTKYELNMVIALGFKKD